ncbi:MAG: SPFH domain-containing protein [Bacteroidales bacterium]|nr:SPFH domain-containing protein [Bacteroidales bacterium]
MKNKETKFEGKVFNGFLMLGLLLVMIPVLIAICCLSYESGIFELCIGGSILLFIIDIIMMIGLFSQQPNEVRVMIFFGKYKGTFDQVGFYWVNPFITRRKMSKRLHNMDIEPIKVNDKIGNPVMIGMVIVWRICDTYRAVFDVDAKEMSTVTSNGVTVNTGSRASALDAFVRIQSDAALREVTGRYAYDDDETSELTLRSGGDEINDQLESKINERLSMAGIEVVEARINYLAYAPEIAAVMLRRQQASAIISAREKIVEGAVSMVKMALDKLEEDSVVKLDDERKAAMVSNLLVVLCADEPATPVVNSGI